MNNKIAKKNFPHDHSYCDGISIRLREKNSAKETIMPGHFKFSKRLETLFLKTKIVCFGRYALEVPREAQLIPGGTIILSEIKTIPGGIAEKNELIEEEIEKIKKSDPDSEIKYNGKGPVEIAGNFNTMMGNYPKKVIV